MPDGRPFMVTEYMALGSLMAVLANPARALGWDVRTRIAAQVADGMAYLHGLKIVHRDFKSDNVLLNDELNAKVADFGTVKWKQFQARQRSSTRSARIRDQQPGVMAIEETDLSENDGSPVGTPLYMAPELIQERPYVGGEDF